MWKYKEVRMPNHPNAKSNGCVLEHRLVAEKILGRYLTDDEVVHHIDENPQNNSIDNLIVFRTDSDHIRFHRTGIMIQGEDSIYYSPQNIVQCENCGKEFAKVNKIKEKFCSQDCFKMASRVVERPNKNELLSLIKSTSFVEIAKIYGVSDTSIRKWCKAYGLPHTKKEIAKLI